MQTFKPASRTSRIAAAFITGTFMAGVLTTMLSPAAHAQTQAAPQSYGAWGDYLAGHHADAIGDNATALKFYAAAARKGLPTTSNIHSRMYVLALTEGKFDEAIKALNKAEASGAKPPLANLSRAVLALRDGKFATAEKLMAQEKDGLTHILAPTLTAWARVGRKDIPGALAALAAQDAAAPDKTKSKDGDKAKQPSPLHLLHGALINDLAGNADAASALFEQLGNGAGLSVRTAQLSAQHFERRGRTEDARAAHQSLGEDGEALILAENLDARQKAKTPPAIDVDTPQKGAAEALYGVASALLGQNALESALALSHMADALRPDFPAASMVKAAALQQAGRRDEANAIYKALSPRSPFSWMARLQLADNFDRMDQTSRAIKLLNQLSRERPTLSRPLVELGDVLRRNERFKDAADAYTRALERVGTPEASHWRLYYSRGIAFEQSKQWPKAEADFLRALELNPNQPLVLNYLGYSWVDQGQHLERAFKMIDTAVKMRPRDGSIVDSLGWAYYRTGDFKAAVKQLERAVMLRPADAVINDHLGDALWRVGRTREARFQWQRALTMEPDAALAKAIAGKLKSGLPALKP